MAFCSSTERRPEEDWFIVTTASVDEGANEVADFCVEAGFVADFALSVVKFEDTEYGVCRICYVEAKPWLSKRNPLKR